LAISEVVFPKSRDEPVAGDDDAVALGRTGVEDVDDPRAVEMDLDFNAIHESAPLCTYAGDTGLARYESVWGDAELGYVPSSCAP
jgi:hypothetical protein